MNQLKASANTKLLMLIMCLYAGTANGAMLAPGLPTSIFESVEL